MSLTALAHQRFATVTVTTATAAGVLDHIYDAITAANDYAAVAIASPLVTTPYQNAGTTEALYGTFGAASAMVPKFLIAGVNAARTPLMGGSHTYSSNFLMVGITKNAGAFASWDHATLPFTSGQNSGLVKFLDCGTVTAAKVYAIVSAESLWVFIESSTGTVYGFGVGALLDPLGTGSNTAETDGRTYSVVSTGTTSSLVGTLNGTGAGSFLNHTASNNATHFLTFTPGGSTLKRTSRLTTNQASSTTTMTTPDGEPIHAKILFYDTVNDRCLGNLREVGPVRDSKLDLRQSPAGVDRWFYVASSSTADSDAIGFLA